LFLQFIYIRKKHHVTGETWRNKQAQKPNRAEQQSSQKTDELVEKTYLYFFPYYFSFILSFLFQPYISGNSWKRGAPQISDLIIISHLSPPLQNQNEKKKDTDTIYR